MLSSKKNPEGPSTRYIGTWVLGYSNIVILVQVLGKYMIIGYVDPKANK